VTLTLFLALSGCGPHGSASEDPAARIEILATECANETGGRFEITVTEAFPQNSEKTRNWVLVDVRTQQEREVSWIAGSFSRAEFEARRDELHERPILVYCTVGCRSGSYVERLVAEGFEAWNLHGGVLAWSIAGREMVDAGGRPTTKVHVYGKRWAVLPAPFENVTGAR
jgi:rhodanese-related sulfurtransferase